MFGYLTKYPDCASKFYTNVKELSLYQICENNNVKTTEIVCQCARFSINPKLSHKRDIKRIICYLKGTKDRGIIMDPDIEKGSNTMKKPTLQILVRIY